MAIDDRAPPLEPSDDDVLEIIGQLGAALIQRRADQPRADGP